MEASRALTGSSLSSSRGRVTIARASETRCRCPPDSWPGLRSATPAGSRIDGRPGGTKIKDARIALNDDYLKFLRWAVWKVVEQPAEPATGSWRS